MWSQESLEAFGRSPLPVEGRRLRWLVIENVLNLLHHFCRHLGQKLQCLNVVINLMSLRCTKNDLPYVLA